MDTQTSNSHQRNGWSRPVALPDDIDNPTLLKATGIVSLPLHVSWSGPARTWDLDNRGERLRVYEMVMTEGTEDDVRRFVEIDELIDLWNDLWLPPHVRRAWSDHLRRLRGVQLAC
jgi:hypothetical protein